MRAPFQIPIYPILAGLGFSRTYPVPREHLDHASMLDQSPAEPLDFSNFESLMSDPMTHLVMLRDNVTELKVRGVISRARARRSLEDFYDKEKTGALSVGPADHCIGSGLVACNREAADRQAIENGENEGMAPALA